MARPLGPITHALLDAATTPATVRELAARAQLGRAAADVTACRLAQRGQLVRLPGKRPARFVAAAHAPAEHVDAAVELQRLQHVFAQAAVDRSA